MAPDELKLKLLATLSAEVVGFSSLMSEYEDAVEPKHNIDRH